MGGIMMRVPGVPARPQREAPPHCQWHAASGLSSAGPGPSTASFLKPAHAPARVLAGMGRFSEKLVYVGSSRVPG